MSQPTERLPEARARLMAVLSQLVDAVAEAALERCPYRTRHDACTFRGECRNQVHATHRRTRCGGGPLDRSPAHVET